MAFVAGTTTQLSSQQHLATVYYNRVGLDILVPKYRFYQAAEQFDLPTGNGKTMQMWRDSVPGTNVQPSAEGVPVSVPFVNGTSTLTATVERYSDFMSTSTMIDLTSIVNEAERMVRALSIRAAASVDTIIRQEIDSLSGDATVYFDATGTSTALTVNDIKKHVSLLEGANVDPFDGTRWLMFIHPYLKYDLITESTAGGFIESLKYANGQKVLNGEIGEAGNARILTSTNVGNDGNATPTSIKYYSPIFGYQGLGVLNLSGQGPDGVVDPKRQNFKIDMYNGGGPWDPTKEVGTVAAYNFIFAAKVLDKTRFHVVKADSSIA